MRPLPSTPAIACSLLALLVAPAVTAADGAPAPRLVELPAGFQPEAVTAGRGPVLYVSNFRDGSIFTVDPRSGTGAILVPPTGHPATGLELDDRTNLLYVAGATSGHAHVYDSATGALVADYPLAARRTFINDVAITRDAAYFTDSAQPVLHELPLGPGGRLPAPDEVRSIPLGGEFVSVRGFNSNGIQATPDGKGLVIVNTTTGTLYHVDPQTGWATAIDLHGGSVVNGDGLVLRGHTLFVMQNFSNQIAVVELSPDLHRGTIVRLIADPAFDIPTTAALLSDTLYVANARFGALPADAPYWLSVIPLGR